jgi:hypothetical protein
MSYRQRVFIFLYLALITPFGLRAQSISGIPVGTIFEFKNHEPVLTAGDGKVGYLTGYQEIKLHDGESRVITKVNSCSVLRDEIGDLHQIPNGTKATLVANETLQMNLYNREELVRYYPECLEITDGKAVWLTLRDDAGVTFKIRCADYEQTAFEIDGGGTSVLRTWFVRPFVPQIDRLLPAVKLTRGVN